MIDYDYDRQVVKQRLTTVKLPKEPQMFISKVQATLSEWRRKIHEPISITAIYFTVRDGCHIKQPCNKLVKFYDIEFVLYDSNLRVDGVRKFDRDEMKAWELKYKTLSTKDFDTLPSVLQRVLTSLNIHSFSRLSKVPRRKIKQYFNDRGMNDLEKAMYNAGYCFLDDNDEELSFEFIMENRA